MTWGVEGRLTRHILPRSRHICIRWRHYGLRRDRLRGGNVQVKSAVRGARCTEKTPFEEGVEGSSPHPSLKGQCEGRGAYDVLRFDVSK